MLPLAGTAFDMESRYVLSYQVKVDPERFRPVDNQAIVSAEMIEANWAPTGTIGSAEEPIAKSNATLGIGLPIQVLGQR